MNVHYAIYKTKMRYFVFQLIKSHTNYCKKTNPKKPYQTKKQQIAKIYKFILLNVIGK